jgi:hypothetical protein
MTRMPSAITSEDKQLSTLNHHDSKTKASPEAKRWTTL